MFADDVCVSRTQQDIIDKKIVVTDNEFPMFVYRDYKVDPDPDKIEEGLFESAIGIMVC